MRNREPVFESACSGRLGPHVLSFLVLALLLITGCTPTPQPSAPRAPLQGNSAAPGKAQEVQLALMTYTDRFIPALAEACDYIEVNAKTPETRATAQSRKVGASLAALKNAVNPQPYAGLLDMVVMVTLLSDVTSTPYAKEIYGPYGQRLRAVLAAQKEDIWALAARFVTDAQLQELLQSIRAWRDAHLDLRYVSFVQVTELPQSRQLQEADNAKKKPNSVFSLLFLDPLSNLDPAVREVERARQLAERMFFYGQRMSIIIGWQTQLLYTQMLSAPEMQSAVTSVATVAGSTTRFSDTSNRVADTAEAFRTDLPQLRDQTIEQLEQAVDRQRDAAIRQATTQISNERDAAIRQLSAAVHLEQRDLKNNLDAVLTAAVDRLYFRTGILLLCVIPALMLYWTLIRILPAPRSRRADNARKWRSSLRSGL
jgi:hypothetical protein